MSRKHDTTTAHDEAYPKEKNGASRGFFAILALCLIAVGGVAAVTFSDPSEQPPLTGDTTDAPTVSTTVTTAVEAVAATTAGTTATTTASPTTTTTEAPSLFVLPLSNKVITPFSEQPVYSETMDDYRAHTGVDFDGEEGQSIRPLADGTVCAVEEDALWGGCITVDHGEGILSVYRGVEASVHVGDEITVDDRLGVVGAVPCESKLGPHLHLELYKDGAAVDATALLSGQLSTE